MPHLIFTLVAAAALSVILALSGRRPAAERVYAAVYVFVCCLVATIAGGWAMRWIHG
jgi:hypothetical protein